MDNINPGQMLKRIEALENEVSELKERLSGLENMKTPDFPPVAAKTPHEPSKREKAAALKKSPAWDSEHWRDGIESLVGGKLLNRIAIVVLLFGMAYFLKYSFDNNWIGVTGRIIIGLVVGLAFLAAGDFTMTRKYRYFSQGLSGGGIAIIYLTTYAATNFYDVFSPAAAFLLMVITALAGGILAVRQNAYAVAILSTLGGFLTPFLIGNEGAGPISFFTYITLLDLGVLFLAYYKNWRSLNFLSLAGTAIVYILFNSTLPPYGPNYTYQLEAYLVIYFVIFGSLAFFYNIRYNQPTKAPDVYLMVLNIAFFLVASLVNLARYPDWHGIFVIALAIIYLVVSILLQRKRMGDNLLFLALLGIGLALVTIAIPIQLDGNWRNSAWVAEGMVLIYAGIKASNSWVSRSGIFVLTMASLFQIEAYLTNNPDYTPVLNTNSFSAFLAIAGFFIVFYLFHSRAELADRRFLLWPSAVYGTLLALRQVSIEATHAVLRYRLDYQVDFAVSLAWIFVALIVIAIGLLKDIKGLRLISLALLGITLIKIMLYDLSNLDIVFRMLILFIVGGILLGISFIYQRKDRKEE